MKLTRAIVLSLAFLAPSVATVTLAQAEDKAAAPAAEKPADGEKKAKKGKKGKKDGEPAKEAAPAPAPAK